MRGLPVCHVGSWVGHGHSKRPRFPDQSVWRSGLTKLYLSLCEPIYFFLKCYIVKMVTQCRDLIQWVMMPFNAFQAWLSKINIFLWIIRYLLSVVIFKTPKYFTVCLKERIVFFSSSPKIHLLKTINHKICHANLRPLSKICVCFRVRLIGIIRNCAENKQIALWN